jgi:RimJ/RimL family protein N-acetyltransferase
MIDEEFRRWNGWSHEQARRHLAIVRHPVWVTEIEDLVVCRADDGHVIGAVSYQAHPSDQHRAALGCRMHPDARGSGYGAELVRLAAVFARQSGLEHLDIGTHRANTPMRRSIERAGGTLVGETPHRMPNGEVVDGVWYRLDLAAPVPQS